MALGVGTAAVAMATAADIAAADAWAEAIMGITDAVVAMSIRARLAAASRDSRGSLKASQKR